MPAAIAIARLATAAIVTAFKHPWLLLRAGLLTAWLLHPRLRRRLATRRKYAVCILARIRWPGVRHPLLIISRRKHWTASTIITTIYRRTIRSRLIPATKNTTVRITGCSTCIVAAAKPAAVVTTIVIPRVVGSGIRAT